jgi:hypothetical protein
VTLRQFQVGERLRLAAGRKEGVNRLTSEEEIDFALTIAMVRKAI